MQKQIMRAAPLGFFLITVEFNSAAAECYYTVITNDSYFFLYSRIDVFGSACLVVHLGSYDHQHKSDKFRFCFLLRGTVCWKAKWPEDDLRATVKQ